MELERVAFFVNQLFDKTNSQNIKWIEDSSNSYVTDIGKYKVSISEHYAGLEESDFVDPDYIVGIYGNGSSKWLDSFSDQDLKDVLPQSFKIMRLIYKSARRNANGLNDIVEDLIKELDSKSDNPSNRLLKS